MALTLVVETGEGLSDANSYATLAEAETYHDTIPTTWRGMWLDASDADKEVCLVRATSLLDQLCPWLGDAVTTGQTLRWPRSGVYTRDGLLLADDAIPQWLKDATSEFGRCLLESNRPAAVEEREIVSRTDGASPISTSVTWASGGNLRRGILPPSVRSIVRPYCSLDSAGIVRT